MKYVIGIDSGGTKFLVKAASREGVLGVYEGAPASHHRLGVRGMIAQAEKNIAACLAGFEGDRADCEAIVCATTGIDCDEDRALVEGAYRTIKGFCCPVVCVNDAEAALYAAAGGVGVVVIAGTGSIAFGRDLSGHEARSGGWPLFLFGDEGSGTWIARHALRHMGFVLDGEKPESPLSVMLRGALGLNGHASMIRLCEEIESGRFQDPGIARLVDEAALAGDRFASSILECAAREAFQLASAVIGKLHFGGGPFRVGAWGSAIVKSPIYFEGFKLLVEREFDGAQVALSALDAADGALMMARKILNRPDPTSGRSNA